VAPLPIIEHLDILKDVLCRLAPRRVLSMVHEFTLQRPEETFHAGVVPAIACAAHAGRDAVRGEQLLVLPGSILTPAIGVMQEFGVGLSSDERHAKCLLG